MLMLLDVSFLHSMDDGVLWFDELDTTRPGDGHVETFPPRLETDEE